MIKAVPLSTLELYALDLLLEESLERDNTGFIRQDLLEKIKEAIQEHEANLRGRYDLSSLQGQRESSDI
jgi:hypothetical protein